MIQEVMQDVPASFLGVSGLIGVGFLFLKKYLNNLGAETLKAAEINTSIELAKFFQEQVKEFTEENKVLKEERRTLQETIEQLKEDWRNERKTLHTTIEQLNEDWRNERRRYKQERDEEYEKLNNMLEESQQQVEFLRQEVRKLSAALEERKN